MTATERPGPDDGASQPDAATLARHLLARALVPPAALARSEEAARVTGASLPGAVLALGLLGEEALASAMAEAFGLPLLPVEELPVEPPLLDCVPSRFLRRARAFPVRLQADGRLLVALADPLDSFVVQAISLAAGLPVAPGVATGAAIEAAHARLGQAEGAPAFAESLPDAAASDEDAERLRDLASEAPVVRHVNALILQAVEAGASDIHLEAVEGGLRARLRVDGMLQDWPPIPSSLAPGIVSRLKIMARLDVAERRLPQDGRLRIAVRGRDVDLRISVIPALAGEGIVLRILDRSTVALDFKALGFTAEEEGALTSQLAHSSGMVLVTGPTGSGKTTTLYAALGAVDRGRLKVCTIEDPVEYRLHDVTQVQVRPQIGLSFPNALSAMLRHNPDVILVGEIRDTETAEVATRAALTGHLVLATLHTNDAPSSVTRMVELGVPEYLVASVLRGALAQRLVRTLCQVCREPHDAPAPLVERLGLARLRAGGADRPITLFRPRGCPHCSGTGFRGRTAVLQAMMVSPALRDLVLRRSDAGTLAAQAAAEGMPTLVEAGLRKALAGVTSVEEVLRVASGT